MARSVAIAIAAILIASPAYAGDGVFEINQDCAGQGCFAGDAAGFPVEITSGGSYVLTGNLDVPLSTTGIEISGDDATLDLNGFTVTGNGGSIDANGIHVLSEGVEIRNGVVRGFSLHGIFSDSQSQGQAAQTLIADVRAVENLFTGIVVQAVNSRVERCTAAGNGLRGIDISSNAVGSVLTSSVARDNASLGFRVFPGSANGAAGWGSNVATNNNGGNANAQVLVSTGAFEISPNICGFDTTCP